tara:strand:+ start:949 stop:1527 length:579 start_codon:yes stop_codon:yes gene_type:complete
MSTNVKALVLAAGSSKRFGSRKLIAKLPDGETVINRTLNRIKLALPDVTVISSTELYSSISVSNSEIEIFADSDLGMGATLSYGIKLSQESNACLVCLADMPFIQASTYREIASKLTKHNIVVPVYNGKQGNPVGFGERFFGELASLNGDKGGRTLIEEYSDATHYIEVDDPTILYDIDTPEDLEKYINLTS